MENRVTQLPGFLVIIQFTACRSALGCRVFNYGFGCLLFCFFDWILLDILNYLYGKWVETLIIVSQQTEIIMLLIILLMLL